MAPEGRIVASAYAGSADGDRVHVYAPDGSELAQWGLDFAASNGLFFQGETVVFHDRLHQQVRRFALDGALLASHDVPSAVRSLWALPGGGVALILEDGAVRQLDASLQLVGDTLVSGVVQTLVPDAGGVLVGGVADYAPDQPVLVASVDAAASLQWTRPSVPWAPLLRVVGLHPHAAGISVLGQSEAATGDCLFEGNVALDGTTFDSTCTPLPGLPDLQWFGARTGSDRSRMLLAARGEAIARVVDVRKPGAAAATFTTHGWSVPGEVAELSGAASGTAAIVAIENSVQVDSSLVRWTQAEAPVFERRLPSSAAEHSAAQAFEDAQGDVVFAVSGVHASHVVKLGANALPLWDHEVPVTAVRDIFEGSDGHYRVLADDAVVALRPDGQIAWTHASVEDFQPSMVRGAQDRALIGYDAHMGCRLRVLDAGGALESDIAITDDGHDMRGALLAEGASVWRCHTFLDTPGYFHRAADGLVVPVDSSGCGLPKTAEPLPLGGTRWALSAAIDGGQRVCVFDGAQPTDARTFAPVGLTQLGGRIVRTNDEGVLVVAFVAMTTAGESIEQLVVHTPDMASRWLSGPRLPDEELVDIAPPRADGSTAWLLRDPESGLRVVSGRAGAMNWSVPLPRSMDSAHRVVLGARGPLVAYSPGGSLDEDYFAVALPPAETVFAGGFE